MSEEEKKAIEFYQGKEVSFTLKNFDKKGFLKALGITETEEDSFENHQIRFKTLLNLIEKQQKEIEKLEADSYESNNIIRDQIDLLKNSVSKDKIRELRDIDNIDLIQYKLKELLEE